ncbi:sugar phosphate nucleotidyltransferase [Alkalicoccobacillus porphyridii]|uniref:Cupin domain-containing protein n=1 Tax=Alkalicoccobacillus porphyridii TaxID=2597270 RepID=A0A554A477_9BACI|nr:sugar phosphate nucleotidyltransferase [Alkalicoccobacillus porphyridii]TSB48482.1 cupin domain-containing protein [Alkalicoccobacillus porphyridii]
MNIVLLSGGSGKRLWPLSNDTRSKQFLKVLRNQYGESESMLQRVWGQLNEVGLAQYSVVTTGKSQMEMINNQLGSGVDIVVEPERRDTFPAIALSAVYLYSVRGISPEESVCILPVDSYVEDEFFLKVKELSTVLMESDADIALVGVKPTYPSEKYGYIIPEPSEEKHYSRVQYFKEKPDQELAKSLIKGDALWNCGVFAFKIDYIISMLEEAGLPISYSALVNQYSSLKKESFDYAVLEKAKDIAVISYDGYWKDLGTWNTLTEEMPAALTGKGIISEDSYNSHLINELDIPVAILGLPDAVVAVSPDGILVSSKQASPRVKELTSPIESRPMYEERRWGWYRVLDYINIDDGVEVLTKRIGIHAGKNISYQVHAHRSEVWTVIKGEGECVIDDQLFRVGAGDVLRIPVGTKHAIKALTDIEFIEVQTGQQLVEEDVVRIRMTWEEVEQFIII